MSSGRTSRRRSGPMPSFSAPPNLKFWITTSLCIARSRTSCWPSGVCRSMPTERLLRLTLLKYAVSVRPTRRPQSRVSSPRPGCSTLITSAPRSPSTMPQVGPANTRERSSTRTPSSGRWEVMSVFRCSEAKLSASRAAPPAQRVRKRRRARPWRCAAQRSRRAAWRRRPQCLRPLRRRPTTRP